MMLRAWVSVAFELSVTSTVKFELPAAVGIPLIVPLAPSDSPAGSEPALNDQLLPPVPPLAESVWLYVAPTVALGSEVVVTFNGGGLATEMLRPCMSVAFELSLTCTVKFAVPLAVGVPLMAPLAESDRPAGSAPGPLDHVYPPVPPLADSVWLYAAPTVPAGSDVVVMVNGGGATVMLRAWVSLPFELSFTCTVKLEVPAAVGVPLMAPLGASVRPGGSEPAFVDQLLPPVPPLAERLRLYGVPTTPAGSDMVLILSGAALRLRSINPAISRQTLKASIMGTPPAKRPRRSQLRCPAIQLESLTYVSDLSAWRAERGISREDRAGRRLRGRRRTLTRAAGLTAEGSGGAAASGAHDQHD